MHLEGDKSVIKPNFFGSNSFNNYNFALLQKLSNLSLSAHGYQELMSKRGHKNIAEKKLKTTLKQIDDVITCLGHLDQLGTVFKTGAHALSPESLFEKLSDKYRWPKQTASTYSSNLVLVPHEVFVEGVAEIFRLQKVSTKCLTVSFRRRGDKVVASLKTPKFSWKGSSFDLLCRKNSICTPQKSDTLEVVCTKACLCFLSCFNIYFSITPLHPQTLFIYLPSSRQLRVFADKNSLE